MPIRVIDLSKLHPNDLTGILETATCCNGIINNYPIRRNAVPYVSIELYANNNRTLKVYTLTPDLGVVNVAGCVGLLTIKTDKNASPLVAKSTNIADQGRIGSPDAGELLFYIKPEDTVNLSTRQYVFDVRLTMSDNNTYTILEGVINLLQPCS